VGDLLLGGQGLQENRRSIIRKALKGEHAPTLQRTLETENLQARMTSSYAAGKHRNTPNTESPVYTSAVS
jgi:hypothetical protein